MMNKGIRVLIAVCVLGLACSAGAMFMVIINKPSQTANQTPTSVREYGLELLPFDLVDHNNNPADQSQLEGEWTVVDFIFTNCVGVCPMMTARMSEVAAKLEGTPVRFASFSLDAKRDTPEQVTKFGELYGADFSRWSFYTGDDSQTRNMVSDGLMLVVGEDEGSNNELTLADGSTMKNILHPTRFFLVAPDLKVVGLYDSRDPAELERLVAEVTEILSRD